MLVRRNERLTQSVVIDRSDLERLIVLFETYVGEPSLEVKCRDRLERVFNDRPELDGFPNSEQRAIQTLNIRATNEAEGASATLEIGNDRERNVYISIQGEPSKAEPLISAVDEWVTSIRSWYHLVASQAWFLLVIATLIVMVIVGDRLGLNTKSAEPQSQTRDVLVIAFTLVTIVTIAIVVRLHRSYFPMATFAFGDGLKRHKRAEVIRIALIAGFVVSVLGSLAVALLTG